jgi:putative transposase
MLEPACPHAVFLLIASTQNAGWGQPGSKTDSTWQSSILLVNTYTVHKRRLFRHLAHVASVREQPVVFFTVVTHARRSLLANEFAHHLLHTIWERSGDLNGWFVGDYLLMPDHLRFFARPAAEADGMRRWVTMWKSLSSRKLMQAAHLRAPIWQEDCFDRFLRSDESYEEKWWYVRNNPVRAGLVTDADAWPYCGRIYDLG